MDPPITKTSASPHKAAPSSKGKRTNNSFISCVVGSGICIVVLYQGVLLYDLTSNNKKSIGMDEASTVFLDHRHMRGPQHQKVGYLNPLFSLEPLKTSLHPRYKLWTEMSTQQQNEALQFVGQYMSKYGNIIAPKGMPLHRLSSVTHGNCTYAAEFEKDGHKICGTGPDGAPIQPPCNFISFGINDDPSFDIILGKWGCRGFAGDPTVDHPSKLHENVTFHNIAATMLQANEERVINKGGAVEWWTTSFPKLRYFLGMEKIDVLKIDCEGCEVALARDMLREDPYFLHHVDQISIETHVTKTWMTTREHIYYFGLLLVLLEEAGFRMEWSSVFGCSKRHEVTGCLDEFAEFDWPCGYQPWPGHPNVVKGRSCQEYTWKRYD
jgi:hypothetical protein